MKLKRLISQVVEGRQPSAVQPRGDGCGSSTTQRSMWWAGGKGRKTQNGVRTAESGGTGDMTVATGEKEG